MKRIRRFRLALCATACTLPQAAIAQLVNPETTGDTPVVFTGASLDSLWPSLAQLAGTLVFVLALIWGTTWLARRLMKGRLGGGGDAQIQVLERRHLAPKKSVEIVSIGNRLLVLGVTESGIGLLTELEPGDLPEPDAAAAGQRPRLRAGRQHALLNEARHKLNELFRTARPADAEAAPSR